MPATETAIRDLWCRDCRRVSVVEVELDEVGDPIDKPTRCEECEDYAAWDRREADGGDDIR